VLRFSPAAVNARNVLIASSSTAPYGAVAKLADLGLSRVIRQQATHKTTNTVGTLRCVCSPAMPLHVCFQESGGTWGSYE
jgi:hypothetical protein